MKALVFERNLTRFAASRAASLLGSGRGAAVGPLRLLDVRAPVPPGEDWHRLRPLLSGICGSDLATVDGRSSRYFADLVSFPFVPGHEVVGILDDGGVDHRGEVLAPGSRVVIEPVLGCLPRNIEPPCPQCEAGHTGGCGNVAIGSLGPGLQTGYCADTGGGWSSAGLVAHASQIHRVPESFSDEEAVIVEPAACGVHAALAAGVGTGDLVVVVGAGTLGLATVAALHHLVRPKTSCTILVGAKYDHQRRHAQALGADIVVSSDQLARSVRRRTGSLVVGGRLTEGAGVVFDCVGSSRSIADALAVTGPRGTVVLVGMPAQVSLDLAPLWHRELRLVGAYAYGVEQGAPAPRRSFDLALDLVHPAGLGSLVSAAYPLERFEDALTHAGSAGRRGATKVVFDLGTRKGTSR
ncbi:MAG: zinc-dependent alcohol dehydrogenase [Acidimicrobiales bacterium]